MLFTRSASDVFNPVTSGGSPRAADMGETQVWGVEVERVAGAAALSGGALVYNAKSVMDADLARPANAAAWVISDPVPANNGIYMKSGASTGWIRVGDLPFQVIPLTVAGTANTLVATSSLPVPVTDRGAVLLFNTPAANTGAATLSVNGGAALPILDRHGNALTTGFFVAGGAAIAVKQGGAYRTFLDTDAGVAKNAAEAARDLALGYRDAAEDFKDAALEANADAQEAREVIQERLLGSGSTFPTLDGGGNPVQNYARFFLEGQPDEDDDGEYYYKDTVWIRNNGAQPALLPRRDHYIATEDGITSVAVTGGYVPGQITVARNGVGLWLGASPGAGPSLPDATAADGETIVFPAPGLKKGHRVSWEITRPSTLDAVTAADATVAAISGYDAENVQEALEEIVTNLAAVEAGGTAAVYHVAVSTAANALTVALKTDADANPSVGSPLSFGFRTAAGSLVVRQLTAASSCAASPSSTFGASSGVPFSLYLALLDDAGTLRLGLVNPRIATGLLALRRHDIVDAQSEGGAGAADSAGVIYAGSSVTAKVALYLERLDWDSGLATAGQWTDPTRWVLLAPGDPLPGDTLNRRHKTESGGTVTGGTSFATIASFAITPRRPQNAIKVSVTAAATITGVSGANTSHTGQLLRGSTNLGLPRATGAGSGSGANLQISAPFAIDIVDYPGVASEVTYNLQHQTSNGAAIATTSAISFSLEEICG